MDDNYSVNDVRGNLRRVRNRVTREVGVVLCLFTPLVSSLCDLPNGFQCVDHSQSRPLVWVQTDYRIRYETVPGPSSRNSSVLYGLCSRWGLDSPSVSEVYPSIPGRPVCTQCECVVGSPVHLSWSLGPPSDRSVSPTSDHELPGESDRSRSVCLSTHILVVW